MRSDFETNLVLNTSSIYIFFGNIFLLSIMFYSPHNLLLLLTIIFFAMFLNVLKKIHVELHILSTYQCSLPYYVTGRNIIRLIGYFRLWKL